MTKKKYYINNIKEFYDNLNEILTDYYEKEIEIVEATERIYDLKKSAEEINLEVDIHENILSNITPSSSYSSSYC